MVILEKARRTLSVHQTAPEMYTETLCLSIYLTLFLYLSCPSDRRDGACGSLVRRLRRKHGHMLRRRIPAALLGVVGCDVGVYAHALLQPHQYVAFHKLPALCRKLHAIRLVIQVI